MALVADTITDCADALIVCWVDETKADGAIGRVDVTNRRATRVLVAWAIYQGNMVQTPEIAPGDTFTQTFRGNAPHAGDVSEIGYY